MRCQIWWLYEHAQYEANLRARDSHGGNRRARGRGRGWTHEPGILVVVGALVVVVAAITMFACSAKANNTRWEALFCILRSQVALQAKFQASTKRMIFQSSSDINFFQSFKFQFESINFTLYETLH